MAFKLLDTAQQRWRRLDGAHLLPLVSAGEKFIDGGRAEPQRSAANLTGNQPRVRVCPDSALSSALDPVKA
ncbi:MAG: hypothetical protein ACLQAT_09990 [Candidatus Binataceae bacterium]